MADLVLNISVPEFFENRRTLEILQRGGMGEVLVWLLFFLLSIALLVMIVIQLVCLADLELDYINPYDSTKKINKFVMPEFITQGVLCFLFLATGHWIMSLLCVPYLYYNVRLYLKGQHLVDVTEIFNLLNWEKKQRLFKLGYILLLLFMSLVWLIFNALEEDEHSF
ncbi:protein cornichon homolog 4-like [Andrographis paniculata]|uniref:protein cornichon homolog 4-like n=1 Tax=Andrographis paniculata TaxID=175694 RepID=UPI0021E92E29|nr:protein cornichon homolog 4-like [Andrographis paniculata]